MRRLTRVFNRNSELFRPSGHLRLRLKLLNHCSRSVYDLIRKWLRLTLLQSTKFRVREMVTQARILASRNSMTNFQRWGLSLLKMEFNLWLFLNSAHHYKWKALLERQEITLVQPLFHPCSNPDELWETQGTSKNWRLDKCSYQVSFWLDIAYIHNFKSWLAQTR